MTDAEMIRHLWTHKTQDHPVLSDEELLIDRGDGIYVWTKSGKRLLDAFSGLAVVNVGYGRAEIADAIRAQAVKLAYYPTTRGFSNRPAAELAAKLATLTPGNLRYTMFAVSGSEANERAVQIARHYWLRTGHERKYKVISLQGGYHGATQGTYALCGLPEMLKAYAPFEVRGFVKVPAPYTLYDQGVDSEMELIERCGKRLATAIQDENPETVSAVIMEPILSSGGFIIPPLGWLKRVRQICDDLNVLMIADEVITGFGRTGRMFACEHEAIVPDIMSLAKGITSGYVPLSATVAHERLADVFPENANEENVHPNTYAAHPLACAAALANIEILEREDLVKNAEIMGTRLRDKLESLATTHSVIGEVRGRGLMVAIEFVTPEGKPLDSAIVNELNIKAWRRGAIVFARRSVLRLAPPLTISADEVDELVGIVGEIIGELQAELPNACATADR